jgi:hypothetical protein
LGGALTFVHAPETDHGETRVPAHKSLLPIAHPVLGWQAANLSVMRSRTGDIRPVKLLGMEKIDGMVARIMARACRDASPATYGS